MVPRGHAAPYSNPQSGGEAPFFTVGPFASMDMLFPGAAGDLDLFTDIEVTTLTQLGVLKSPSTGTTNPHIPSPASKMEPDSSIRKRGYGGSPSCRHPVSTAAGSFEDLGKLEHEREAAHATNFTEKSALSNAHTMSRDSTHGHITGDGHSMLHSNVADPLTLGFLVSILTQRSDGLREGGLTNVGAETHQSVLPHLSFYSLLQLQVTPSQVHFAPSLDLNRGSLPLDRGVDAEVPVSSAGLVTPSSVCQPVQSSGQLANAQVDSIFVTSGLTAEQYEEIFLLSHEVQTLCGKLALDFIELSNQEAQFHMGAQAMSHEKAIREHPDHSTGKHDEATHCSGEVTWLQTNSLLFRHTIEYQNNMIQLITRSQEAIQALHECIWKVVRRVMESAGKSMQRTVWKLPYIW